MPADPPYPAPTPSPLSIWAVSAYELLPLVQRCAPDYADRARVQRLKAHFDDAADMIRAKLRTESCDVILTAGANADYLRSQLDVPVVAVRVGGYDVMAALARARQVSDRIALMLYRHVPEEMRQFIREFDLKLDVRAYDTENDARNTVAALQAEGVQVVIGAGLAVHLAQQQGMAGVFLYSRHSVNAALEDAINLGVAQQAEKSRRITLANVLEHLHEGVVAVDARGRVVAANPAAQRLTGSAPPLAIGAPLNAGVPELDPGPALRNAARGGSGVYSFQGRQVVVDSSVLHEGGVVAGAVYTLRESNDVRQAFHKLRRHERRKGAGANYTLDQIVQASPPMQAVVGRCRIYATRGEATVLITGPSGVGKELLAQGMHHASPRRHHAFVAVNCGALTESLLESELFGYEEGAFTGARRSGKAGLVEAAHQGTLFLDEIAELPFALQTRLLRVLQEREITRVGAVTATPVDLRVIVATHRDLLAMVREGTFREDLYYRIAVLCVAVPPLKSRPADVDALSRRFVSQAMRDAGMDQYEQAVLDVLPAALADHDWPGNGRELENVAQRIAMACAEQDAPLDAAAIRALLDRPGGQVMDDAATLTSVRRSGEREYAQAVLAECGGNHAAAARKLGVSRSTLWRKLRGSGG